MNDACSRPPRRYWSTTAGPGASRVSLALCDSSHHRNLVWCASTGASRVSRPLSGGPQRADGGLALPGRQFFRRRAEPGEKNAREKGTPQDRIDPLWSDNLGALRRQELRPVAVQTPPRSKGCVPAIDALCPPHRTTFDFPNSSPRVLTSRGGDAVLFTSLGAYPFEVGRAVHLQLAAGAIAPFGRG